jgi:methylated-DNA-[protein]-cysteine S-methyltransferase
MDYLEYRSPLGSLLLAASETGLAGIYFERHRHFHGIGADWRRNSGHRVLQAAQKQLEEYFAGRRCRFDLSLDLSAGTPFQQSVWRGLLQIPYGATLSYGQLAQNLGKPAAVRAVGAANGRNPISIIVPCHRVVASDGALTGYAGGVSNKQKLLDLEGMGAN